MTNCFQVILLVLNLTANGNNVSSENKLAVKELPRNLKLSHRLRNPKEKNVRRVALTTSSIHAEMMHGGCHSLRCCQAIYSTELKTISSAQHHHQMIICLCDCTQQPLKWTNGGSVTVSLPIMEGKQTWEVQTFKDVIQVQKLCNFCDGTTHFFPSPFLFVLVLFFLLLFIIFLGWGFWG